MKKTTSAHLHYYMAESHSSAHDFPVLMVTLIGEISEANSPDHENCLKEILNSSAKWVVVNFRDIFSRTDPANQVSKAFVYDETLVSFIDLLRKGIHSRGGHLRLSGIPMEIRKTLEEKNLVLENEFANNLKEALASLPNHE